MLITKNESLRNFNFWSGACDRVKYLTLEELDEIEAILEELYPEGLDETAVNDLFWFEEDTIAEWLGYNNFDEIIERDEEEEDEEDEDEEYEEELYYTYIDNKLYYELTSEEAKQLNHHFKQGGLYCIQCYIEDNIKYYQLQCNDELKQIIGA